MNAGIPRQGHNDAPQYKLCVSLAGAVCNVPSGPTLMPTPRCRHVLALNDDVIGAVCSALPVHELLALMQTCKRLKAACEDCEQWELAANEIEKEFPLPIAPRLKWVDSTWRKTHDPRLKCQTTEWEATAALKRFALMVPFARDLTRRAHDAAEILGEYHADEDNLEMILVDEDVSFVEFVADLEHGEFLLSERAPAVWRIAAHAAVERALRDRGSRWYELEVLMAVHDPSNRQLAQRR